MEFSLALSKRVQELEAQIEPAALLLSGGGLSNLMALAWSRFQTKPNRPLDCVYIQFRDFVWLERDRVRKLCRTRNWHLHEIAVDERADVTAHADFWPQVLLKVREQMPFADGHPRRHLVSGFGWPNLARAGDDLALAPDVKWTVPASQTFRSDFYTPGLWQSFCADPGARIFFELWSELPFPNIRYWQDFVFCQHFPDYEPCEAWRTHEYLRVQP